MLKEEWALAHDALTRGLAMAQQCDPELAQQIELDVQRCEFIVEGDSSGWCMLL